MRRRKKLVMLPTAVRTTLEDTLGREVPRITSRQKDEYPEIFMTSDRRHALAQQQDVIIASEACASEVEMILIEAGFEYNRETLVQEVKTDLVRQLRESRGENPDHRRKPLAPGNSRHTVRFKVGL